jgi:hypothetical protein
MNALKNKLMQKVEVLNTEVSNVSTGITNPSLEQQDNVIVLKNADNNAISSIVPSFAITLNEAKERILMLQNFVKEMMVPNIDYGLIPKSDKPSLFKPGAEKLCDIFGFSKQVEILNRIEDWDKGLFHYEVKVLLTNKRTGLIEAEGIGSCNNKERKFKNQDSFSIINTILKMSKKRALIDAVLSATRSSGLFTQDLEDLEYDKTPSAEVKNDNRSNPYIPRGNIPTKATQSIITKQQQTQIFVSAAKNKIPLDYVKSLILEKYNVSESKMLTSEQADELIALLESYCYI